jgi:hypothetical protein
MMVTTPTFEDNLITPMDSFQYECKRQSELKAKFESEGLVCVDDPANLADFIGTVKPITAYCEMFTPRLLAKLFVEGTSDIERAFHLVPVHQLVRWGYFIPKEQDTFTTNFVIGVRKVSEQGYVPALRLPL